MKRKITLIEVIAVVAIITIALSVLGGFSSVGLLNKNTYTITVNDKETKRFDKEDKYLIFATIADGEDIVFENTDAGFLGKWDSSDFQNKLKVDHTYIVETMGFRIPFLSKYQNIIKIKEEVKNNESK